jgi:FHS family L-fucose permease-like MFS transporter
MWGFITVLNDILIPHFKEVFTLTYFESSLIQFSFFGAYFIGSLIYFIISSAYGDPINRIGYKNGIILGLLLSATGTFLFYPAAQFISFGFFLVALFILALGFTWLQIAANPYVAILGKPETASHRLNLSQAFNSLGTTLAPILGGVLILGTSSGIDSVKMPYLMFTGIFLLLSVVFRFTHLPSFASHDKMEKGMGALKFPQLSLGMLAIFFYVGGEVTVGSFLNNFACLPEIKNIEAEHATAFVALYWGSLMIGRFTGSVSIFKLTKRAKSFIVFLLPVAVFFFILWMIKLKGQPVTEMMNYLPYILIAIGAFFISQFKPSRMLFIFSLIGIVLLTIVLLTKGDVALYSLISLGLYNSIMWPVIFTLAITGLGKFTSQGSSLLVMMILGGALIPPLQGKLADVYGLHFSFIVPVFCFAYLAFYGWKVNHILKKQEVMDESAISPRH